MWAWVAFKTLLPWLVFFRLTFEGDTYRWGTQYFARSFYSTGLERPDFLLIYALLAFGIFLLMQLRIYHFRLAAPLLVIYLGVFAADAVFQLWSGATIVFQGDTLGIRVNITLPYFVLQIGLFIVALAWWSAIRGIDVGSIRPLEGVRKSVAFACSSFIPIQVALLVIGEPHGVTDQVGVVGTLLQWALLAWAFFPGGHYRVTE